MEDPSKYSVPLVGNCVPQVNNPERGFSVLGDGPLDMRMDPQVCLFLPFGVLKFRLIEREFSDGLPIDRTRI